MTRLRAGLLLLLPLSACASWSAPEVIPIRGKVPRQILILPVSKSSLGREFAAQLDEAAGLEIEKRGYQSIRPRVARTLLAARGWSAGETEPGNLPLETLKTDHEVDAVMITQLGDWQAEPSIGRYRYRVFWTLFDCETGREIWRYDDGGQVQPERQIGEPQILYDEDVAHGPGPRRQPQAWDRMSIEELAGLLQRAAALRLPYGPEHPDHAWTVR
ncbi:MAG: hypothetical protein ACYTG5_18340 [Planctomycetota bacterium]|jgi:hypothetical protein